MCIFWAAEGGQTALGTGNVTPQPPTTCLHDGHSSMEDMQSVFCRGHAEDTGFAQDRKDGLDHLPPKDPKTTSPYHLFRFQMHHQEYSEITLCPKGPTRLNKSIQHQPGCKLSLCFMHGETESQRSLLCSWTSVGAE